MLKEFSNSLGIIIDKYKMGFLQKKEDKIEEQKTINVKLFLKFILKISKKMYKNFLF